MLLCSLECSTYPHVQGQVLALNVYMYVEFNRDSPGQWKTREMVRGQR